VPLNVSRQAKQEANENNGEQLRLDARSAEQQTVVFNSLTV
jgi:hypothetical protein